MYKILIHIDTQSGDKWFYYQENGKDYVTNSLQEIKDTVLTLIDVYGEDYIKIVKQMSGQDMDNADVYIYDSTDNYEELNNRPYINGVEIVGQLTLEDLGIQPMGNYATEEYVDNSIANLDIPEVDLTNYATIQYVDDATGDLATLATEDKTNLVNAINEIANTGSACKIYTIEVSTALDWSINFKSEDLTLINNIINEHLDENVIINVYKGNYSYVFNFRFAKPTTTTGNISSNIYGIRNYNGTIGYQKFGMLHTNYSTGTIAITSLMSVGSYSDFILNSVDQGIYSKKTFYTLPETSVVPTTDTQMVNKKYVDDNIQPCSIYKAFAPDTQTIQINGDLVNNEVYKELLTGFIKKCIEENSFNKILHLGLGSQTMGTGSYLSIVFDQCKKGSTRYTNVTSHEYIYYGRQLDDVGVSYTAPSDFVYKLSIFVIDNEIEDPIQSATISNQNISSLTKTNTWVYTPTSDYHPATKKYVDDTVAEIPTGPNNIIKLTGAYDFFKNYDVSYPQFNDTDLLSLQNYINDNYDGVNLVSLLPLNIINNSTKPDYSDAQNIIITDVQLSGSNIISFTGHIYFTDEVIGTNNSPYTKIYDISLFAAYTETDGVYTISMVGFRTRPRAVDCLTKGNTAEYTPIGDYNPATKKYVDDAIANIDIGGSDVPEHFYVLDFELPSFYLNNSTTFTSEDSKAKLLELFNKIIKNEINKDNVIIILKNSSATNRHYICLPDTQNAFSVNKTNGVTTFQIAYWGIYYEGRDIQYANLYANITVNDEFTEVLSVNRAGLNWSYLRLTDFAGKSEVLTKTNTTSFTPTSSYHPATKKYVDDAIAGVSGGSGSEVDLTNYYTKAEVDALLQALRDEFISANNSINDKLETIIYGGE